MIRNRMLGGSLHPFYRAILLRGLELGYELPSSDCQRLQNKLVVDLNVKISTTLSVWDRLDYLYVLASHFSGGSGVIPFLSINWINPSQSVGSAMAGTSYVAKKGVSGTHSFGFDQAIHRVKMVSEQDCSMFGVWGLGGTPAANEHVHYQQNTAANRLMVLQARTTPSVVLYFNTATPLTLQAGVIVAQRLYTVERSLMVGGHTYGEWQGGTKSREVIGGATGNLPGENRVAISGAHASRPAAALGGGGGLSGLGGATILFVPPLNTALNNYLTALNTLP